MRAALKTGLRLRNRMNRVGLTVATLLLLQSLSCLRDSASAESKSFLWKVRSKTNTVYLLGSIHLLKKEMYPLDRKIEEAFQQSDVLAVEANLNGPIQLDLQKMLEKAIYSDNGDTLEGHVSAETYEVVKKKAGELGIPFELLTKQKPWFLGLMFTSVGFLKLGFDPAYGIDQYFLSKATGKKTVLELESLDYQLNLLSNFSDRDQEKFLLMALKDLDTLGQDVDKFLRAWATGDTKGLERMATQSMTEDSRLSSVHEVLIYDRNKKMVSRIEEYLKTKEAYFVVVGAAHLIGEKGIVELLKSKGYSVEQM